MLSEAKEVSPEVSPQNRPKLGGNISQVGRAKMRRKISETCGPPSQLQCPLLLRIVRRLPVRADLTMHGND
jgi:hypothetical protein